MNEIEEFKVSARAARPYGLSFPQIEFALAYLRHGNAKKAAIEAGYKQSTAEVKGNRMLRHPGISAFIREQLEKMFDAEAMSTKEIIARLGRIARVDPGKIQNDDGSYKKFSEMDEATRFCIRGWEDELRFDADGAPPTMTRKVKMADPIPALRTLAQINQLLSPDVGQLNVFINLDRRADAARKRVTEQKAKEIEDAKIVSQQ